MKAANRLLNNRLKPDYTNTTHYLQLAKLELILNRWLQ